MSSRLPSDELAADWKEVRGFPDYLVHRDGRIVSFRTASASFMRTTNGKVRLTSGEGANKSTRYLSVAKIVLEAFVGLSPRDHYATHLDGDPENNRVENLRWQTRYRRKPQVA